MVWVCIPNVTVYWNINQVSFIKEHGMGFPRRHEQTSAHRWIIGGSRGRQQGHNPLPHPLSKQVWLWYIGVFSPLLCRELGFEYHYYPVLLYFSKKFFPYCCSRPRCLNGDPVGCKWYVEYVVACNAMIGSSARNAPLGVEVVHCETCVVLNLYPKTGVIICCPFKIPPLPPPPPRRRKWGPFSFFVLFFFACQLIVLRS